MKLSKKIIFVSVMNIIVQSSVVFSSTLKTQYDCSNATHAFNVTEENGETIWYFTRSNGDLSPTHQWDLGLTKTRWVSKQDTSGRIFSRADLKLTPSMSSAQAWITCDKELSDCDFKFYDFNGGLQKSIWDDATCSRSLSANIQTKAVKFSASGLVNYSSIGLIIDFFGKIKVLNALAGLDVRFKIISVVRLRSDLFFTCLYILN